MVDAVATLDGGRVSEVSDHIGIPVSTVHGHLKTHHDECYLMKGGDEYHVGLQFFNHDG